MTSKREYDKAKAEYATWEAEHHADPSDEMLAVVQVIRDYEAEQDKAEQTEA